MDTQTQTQRRQRLSALLKSKRQELGLSQRDLGKQLGFRQATIHLWEAQKGDTDIASLEKIAKFFGYSTNELWTYLEGTAGDSSSSWDVEKILGVLDTMQPSDLAKIGSVVMQKLAKAS
jgi:transcriptional regulator with XRE-family HTH domain